MFYSYWNDFISENNCLYFWCEEVFERSFCLVSLFIKKKMQERGTINATGKSSTKKTKNTDKRKLGKILHLRKGLFLDLNIFDNEAEKRAKCHCIKV